MKFRGHITVHPPPHQESTAFQITAQSGPACFQLKMLFCYTPRANNLSLFLQFDDYMIVQWGLKFIHYSLGVQKNGAIIFFSINDQNILTSFYSQKWRGWKGETNNHYFLIWDNVFVFSLNLLSLERWKDHIQIIQWGCVFGFFFFLQRISSLPFPGMAFWCKRNSYNVNQKRHSGWHHVLTVFLLV